MHPIATTSLLAQSNDQQDVSSSSMRRSGSASFTESLLAISYALIGRAMGTAHHI